MHHGVEGKQTPHRAKGLCCYETKCSEGDRAQQHPQQEGKATRPSQKQPDTQREGPAKKLDQDATKDQPQGEGKHQSAGEGSQQQPNQRQQKGGPTTHKKGHDDHGQTPIAAQAETPTQRNHNQRGATHERKQNTRPRTTDGRESTAQGKTAPNQPTRQNKKGGHEGTEPHRGTQKDPHHTAASGSKPYCGAQGKRAQEIKWQNDNKTAGRREGRGGSLRQTPCSIFKVVLFICSKSVIPAVPNRKGDRVSSLFPCGKKPQFIAFSLKGNPVSLLRFPT